MKKAALAALLLLAALWFGRQPTLLSADTSDSAAALPAAGNAVIADAYSRRLRDVPVEAEGRVVNVLPDDVDGSRHQRFLLDTGAGHTVLVAHNIDLAPRIDGLRPGDTVGFKGEYVWNAKGGVVHWTHHDPDGRHPGGWLLHQGRRYR
ncbi:MAG: DUF3465 domain-containing protein [Arenimonas sp.]